MSCCRAPRVAACLLVAACSTPPSPPVDCTHVCDGRVCGREPVCNLSCGECADDGVCSADGASCRAALPIGSACTSHGDCGTFRLCLGPLEGALGGYCSKRCGDDAPCPGDAVCRLGASGENVCLARCVPAGAPACREAEGYRCDAQGFCPACVPDCSRRVCGDDGCGGSCGTCEEPATACSAGSCVSAWQAVGTMPAPRYDLAAVGAADGSVWLVGGRKVFQDPGGVVYGAAVPRVERHFPGQDRTTASTPLPVALAWPHAAEIDGNLYVAGGTLHADRPEATDSPSAGFWSLEGTAWRVRDHVPAPSMGGGAVALGGKLYLFRGRTAEGVWSRGVDVYDPTPTVQSWRTLDQRPTGRAFFAVASDGNRAWLAGGRDAATTLATVEVFDPATGWSRAADLPVPVAGARAVVAGARLFVFGGWDGPSPQLAERRAVVQVVDLATRRASLVGTTMDTWLGMAAASTRDDKVLLFGGMTWVAGLPVDRADIVRFLVPAP